MSVRIGDVRAALEAMVRRDAESWSRGDPFISKKDAARDATSWRPEVVREAADEVRALEGKGSRVTVKETTAHLMEKVEDVWGRFNAGDTDALGSDELDAMAREFPQLAELTRRAVAQAETNAQRGHPERVETLAQFNALDRDVRALLLDEYEADSYANISMTPELFVDELRGRKKAFAEKLVAAMEGEAGDPPEDWGHIGGPKVRVRLFTLPSGEIAGGHVYMRQQGFDPNELDADDVPWHFDTPAAARAAGYDPDQDISWAASGTFDSEGEHIAGDTYWDWTGW
jgi:hypothetical protein